MFVNRAWTFGGTSVGTGQYIDAFERAAFWHYTKTGGTNPTYGLQLALKTLPAKTVTVPGADAYYYSLAGTPCGNGKLADVNINWLSSYLRTTLMPSLVSAGVGPTTFPIFLVHNVAMFQNNVPADCCVLGYHDALPTASGIDTYAIADYENSGGFTTTHDVQVLAHEVGEWANDPLGTNPTPAWGHIGQVTGCQSNLEVGDPLSGSAIPVASGGFTYHPQELAFFSWFYRQTPSLGVNGWYSNNGTLKTVQVACT